MFYYSRFNKELDDWNINGVSNMDEIFVDSSYSRNIGNWVRQRPDIDFSKYLKPYQLVYKFKKRWIEYNGRN
jgi:hypothetical protein